MNSRKLIAAASGALLAVAGGRVLGAEKHGHGDQGDLATLGQTRITLADAVAAAERQTGGKAMEAGVEQENGAVVFEVKVASNGAVQKVLVDGQSGKVLKAGPSSDGQGDDGEEDDD